jgi:hypothetical protein
MPAPPPLAEELIESSVRFRAGDFTSCIVDAEVVPGQRPALQVADVHLSINDSGHVQNVTVQMINDPDVNECLVRKASGWMFPKGGTTNARLEFRLQGRSAELASVRIVPLTRTASQR